MKIFYTYQQHCIAECSGVLEVPADVIAKGDTAVHEYIYENEQDANDVSNDIVEWCDLVHGSMDYEKG
jgi:hypothetical protein